MTSNQKRETIAALLLKSWDPIAGADDADAQARRRAYVDEVLAMLASGASDREVAEFLVALETQMLGYQDSDPRMLRPLAKKLRLLYRRSDSTLQAG
jgi:hypothetical protein